MNLHGTCLLAASLGGLGACAPTSPPPAEDSGARIYSGNCISCHQPDGRGVQGVYPSLAGSPVVLGDPKALALWVVKGRRTPSMPPGRYSTSMPQYGWMKDSDAASLLTYLRSSFGNTAPAVDTATVSQALGE
jgi:mono/diheme cytochrome c family protein